MTSETYDVFGAHPHLKGMLQYPTESEILDLLTGGATIYCTTTHCQSPAGIIIQEVLDIGIYDGSCMILRGSWIYYVHEHKSGINQEFVNNLTNCPVKAVFDNLRRAEKYYEMCQKAFFGDREWRRAYLTDYDLNSGWEDDHPNSHCS